MTKSKKKHEILVKMVDCIWKYIFLYNLIYTFFVWMQHGVLTDMVFALDPSNSVIKRLWCVGIMIEITSINPVLLKPDMPCLCEQCRSQPQWLS